MRPRGRGVPAAVALPCVLALGLAGCGDQDSPQAWPGAGSPIDTDPVVFAVDDSVVVSSATTLETPGVIEFVVAGEGVWYRVSSSEASSSRPNALPELRLSTPDARSDVAGVHVHPGTLAASPDGRWLALVDRAERGTGHAELVVVDTRDGSELVRTRDGLGQGEEEDWTDYYEEVPVGVLGVDATTVYAFGPDGAITVDLADGTVEVKDLPVVDLPGAEAVAGEFPRTSPDGSWTLRDNFPTPRPVVEGADGTEVRLEVPPLDDWAVPRATPAEMSVTAWLDDDTLLAQAVVEGGADEWSLPALLTCEVPSGECAFVPGTEQGALLPRGVAYEG